MKIGQGIGHMNLMCPVEDATSDGMSIKRPHVIPHGSKVALGQWRLENFGKP
jgi:hypothetical protein